MNKRVVFGLMLTGIAALFAWSGQALATPVTQTINLDQVFTGPTPSGTAPWLVATFQFDPGTSGTDTGTLTLTSYLSDGNFVQGGSGATGWRFNLGNIGLTGSDCTAGNCGTLDTSVKGGPGGLGSYDFGYSWTESSRFDGSDTATYTLTFDSVFTTSPFTANDSGWISAAHIQGIPLGNGTCSAWIVDAGDGTGTLVGGGCGSGGTTDVPEPGVLGLFGLGVLLIGGFVTWRRRCS